MRLKLTLAYDGTGYSGWQIQEKPNPPRTIQGAVEAALFQLAGQKIRVHGAGRTDAGVHALGQVCHFDAPDKNWDWQKRLNAVLDPQIRVIRTELAAPTFHARKDAIAKTYFYDLWTEPAFVLPSLRNFCWHCGKINLTEIQAGLKDLSGKHDFSAFQNTGTPVKSGIREIYSISLEPLPKSGYFPPALYRMTIRGNGFLKQMVRNIAGYLVWIGKGKCAWSDLPAIIAAKSREKLPSPTAPAKGLTLAKVDYE